MGVYIYARGSKRVNKRHNSHFLFLRVAKRSKPRMPGWYKLDRLASAWVRRSA